MLPPRPVGVSVGRGVWLAAAGRRDARRMLLSRRSGSPGAAGRASAFSKTSQRTGEEGIAAASPADGTWLGSVLFLQAVNWRCQRVVQWSDFVETRCSDSFYVAFWWFGVGPTVIWREFYLSFAFPADTVG